MISWFKMDDYVVYKLDKESFDKTYGTINKSMLEAIIMKKYILIIYVFVLMAFIAGCNAPNNNQNGCVSDLPSLSDDELTNLATQVNNELLNRNIKKEYIYPGIFTVGEDIKPGIYTVSSTKIYDAEDIGYQIDNWNEEKQYWEMDFYILFNSEGQKGTFTLKENQRLIVANVEFEIIDYKSVIQ